MSLTNLEKFKIDRCRKAYGDMTSDEALLCALQAEQFKKNCGPGDIAFGHFSNEQTYMEEFAMLLEKEENSK
jgi:hypothetical protein